MIEKIIISGFADEIDPALDVQLKVVKELGMEYICLRAADGKGIADYTVEEFKESILPRLNAAGVKISSLGSPIGKIDIDDEAAYEKQLAQLDTLCQICNLADCKYIRMFSFWMLNKNPDEWKEEVLKKLRGFADIAAKYGVILIHENEKDIYGDIGSRCKTILDELASPYFKAAFDFANFVQCGEDTAQCWELLKEHVAYIHIKILPLYFLVTPIAPFLELSTPMQGLRPRRFAPNAATAEHLPPAFINSRVSRIKLAWFF